MIEYAADTTGWEAWMREYAFGAFYIFPPDDVIGPIDALREAYDPKSASICQAHVSLSEPLRRRLAAHELRELTTALREVDPFVIRYGPLRSFPPYPGVVYAISPEEQFRELRSAIHGASVFTGVVPSREHVAPHMTIAEFISLARTEELLDELEATAPTGEFVCDRIELAVPDAEFRFRRVLAVLLGEPGLLTS